MGGRKKILTTRFYEEQSGRESCKSVKNLGVDRINYNNNNKIDGFNTPNQNKTNKKFQKPIDVDQNQLNNKYNLQNKQQ